MRVAVSVFALVVCGSFTSATARAADAKVEALKDAPTDLSATVTAALNPTGVRISDAKGAVCDVWLAKEPPLVPGFKSTLQIKYPFQPGQLIGAVRFPAASMPSDFRGQNLKPGIYTLRYGLQPNDGNHLGTSEIRDFLVACPAKEDVDPKPINDVKNLFKLGGMAAGTTHPAIFPLLEPAEKPYAAPAARHEDEKDLLILDANFNGKEGDASRTVPFSLVARGKAAD